MEKTYKLIILIVSSHDVEVYSQMKELSQKYYDLYQDQIRYFYIEYKPDIENDVMESGNHIYVKGT